MNSNDFYQLAAELNVMDFTKSKPNYADLARKYGGASINLVPVK